MTRKHAATLSETSYIDGIRALKETAARGKYIVKKQSQIYFTVHVQLYVNIEDSKLHFS